jgi:hypothetical protein
MHVLTQTWSPNWLAEHHAIIDNTRPSHPVTHAPRHRGELILKKKKDYTVQQHNMHKITTGENRWCKWIAYDRVQLKHKNGTLHTRFAQRVTAVAGLSRLSSFSSLLCFQHGCTLVYISPTIWWGRKELSTLDLRQYSWPASHWT